MNKPSFSDEALTLAVSSSLSASEVITKLNLVLGGATRKTINKHIKRLKLDTSHWDYGRRSKQPLQDILVENSKYKNLTSLKRILIKAKLLEYKCYECELSSWRNRPITLQVHHENGKRTDNRLINIKLLCPNCHSQTKNYAGKNKKIKYS